VNLKKGRVWICDTISTNTSSVVKLALGFDDGCSYIQMNLGSPPAQTSRDWRMEHAVVLSQVDTTSNSHDDANGVAGPTDNAADSEKQRILPLVCETRQDDKQHAFTYVSGVFEVNR